MVDNQSLQHTVSRPGPYSSWLLIPTLAWFQLTRFLKFWLLVSLNNRSIRLPVSVVVISLSLVHGMLRGICHIEVVCRQGTRSQMVLNDSVPERIANMILSLENLFDRSGRAPTPQGRKVLPCASACYQLYVEPTRQNLILPNLQEQSRYVKSNGAGGARRKPMGRAGNHRARMGTNCCLTENDVVRPINGKYLLRPWLMCSQ